MTFKNCYFQSYFLETNQLRNFLNGSKFKDIPKIIFTNFIRKLLIDSVNLLEEIMLQGGMIV